MHTKNKLKDKFKNISFENIEVLTNENKKQREEVQKFVEENDFWDSIKKISDEQRKKPKELRELADVHKENFHAEKIPKKPEFPKNLVLTDRQLLKLRKLQEAETNANNYHKQIKLLFENNNLEAAKAVLNEALAANYSKSKRIQKWRKILNNG